MYKARHKLPNQANVYGILPAVTAHIQVQYSHIVESCKGKCWEVKGNKKYIKTANLIKLFARNKQFRRI
jgi:hypothetical protein